LYWAKCLYNLEKKVKTGISYFSRFENKGLLYNIKAGVGLIQHSEASQINGIPTFINLFIPITGFRSWTFSLILLIVSFTGFIFTYNNKHSKTLLYAILLIMKGLILAGTGFSRYWLPLLPGFLLGLYFLYRSLNLDE